MDESTVWIVGVIAVLVLIIWETIWKAFGLWNSAKYGDKIWFVFMFILNTGGLLPLIYLLLKTDFFKKKKKKKK